MDTPCEHTIQFEEMLDVWPCEQVLQNLKQVMHSLPIAPGPGLGDHSGHERAELPQVSAREALEDTGLRLRENEEREGGLGGFLLACFQITEVNHTIAFQKPSGLLQSFSTSGRAV